MAKEKGDTKARILAIAAELFAAQGYAGTSIADIAQRLGTTPAALYYHFASKADVLDGLLAEPMAGYVQLAELAVTAGPEELLAAFIDFTARSHALIPIVSGDPAARALLDERLPRKPADMFADVIAALAGPDPDRAALLRAHAAFAVAKETTTAALRMGGGVLGDADRAEVLAIATHTLRP
ncbi:MAG TPA: helix-turn-helix domain-containing protein [Pseudonocardiaceae bacterium]|nr:helix-turn-helix domain-containing protein [Pseudonocardiaceae bacterium]